MDSSVSPKDETWFLRVCHHISAGVYLKLCEPLPRHQQFVSMSIVFASARLERPACNSEWNQVFRWLSEIPVSYYVLVHSSRTGRGWGQTVTQLVETLRYKPGDRRFNFSLTFWRLMSTIVVVPHRWPLKLHFTYLFNKYRYWMF